MVIDNNPLINIAENTFEVEYKIDATEDVSIFINGLLGIHQDDIILILNNIIKVNELLNLDYLEDTYSVVYTKNKVQL